LFVFVRSEILTGFKLT